MFLVNKELGITPLQAIKKFQKEHPEVTSPLTYAGRLDPLAEGLLPILKGNDTKLKEEILSLPKTYIAKIILGVSTDTGDLLGIIKEQKTFTQNSDLEKTIIQLKGSITLPLPLYSSVPYQGKPLFVHAKNKTLTNTPERTTEIYESKLLSTGEISKQNILERLELATKNLEGEFRQSEIFNTWQNNIPDSTNFHYIECEFKVSSGTYIRSLAEYIGKKLNTQACLFSLKRTKVGNYKI